ncbi:unnamed protein product [Pseudo-nitzschia multistriata]|uniref:aspartyl aminopeptidase n=1 Tax=Pseudo-nitzschia multistriata TaxID=183589 RepID=A0A448Z9H6_9STRA|nr:unnamed protein product [Pseudo-nitzschia multistriata]
MSSSNPYAKYASLAEKACEFLTASPDPFYVVHNCVAKLEANGYTKLNGSRPFTGQLVPGGKYYYVVDLTTLVAFCVGPKLDVEKEPFGFHIVAGHTDSPNLRIKPRSKRSASGCTQLAVETYGGGLWHTWFDRDLSVCGRVLLQEPQAVSESGRSIVNTKQRLVNLEDPIARISTLAIHLQSAEERKGFSVNKENHTAPIIATKNTGEEKIGSQSNKQAGKVLEQEASDQINALSKWQESQEPLLLKAIADKLETTVESIVDFDLSLYDTQGAALGGISKEFLYSARLDNLATVFAGLEGLVSFTSPSTDEGIEALNNSSDVSVAVFFDHEEVGSTSAQGAGSPVMQGAIQRISAALYGGASPSPDVHQACINKSFVLSIDQAHAIHPNYSAKHESNHAPTLNGGLVIKTNSNQRYATSGISGFVVRELGRIADIPIDEFVVRNDCGCGSTIGPTISARTGIRVVDAGMPQLSMHSCREVMGIADLSHGIDLFRVFYQKFRQLDGSICREVTK